MNRFRFTLLAILLSPAHSLAQQKAPEMGYIFPPAGQAGTTVEVKLGGYNWTPDLELLVSDPRVKLVPSGALEPIYVVGPPYWFGAKGRLTSHPLGREMPAKLIIPKDMPPGPITWRVANANGGSSPGAFFVSTHVEQVEDESKSGLHNLATIPASISGRIFVNEEVDRYRFVAPKTGLITCDLQTRRLGSKFLGILEVRDAKNHLIADVSGNPGADPVITFLAQAGQEYTVSIQDVDFAGDRSFVYRLTVAPGTRITGAIPAAGKAGESQEVEFVGLGLSTGANQLESVKRQVKYPNLPGGEMFDYRLDTPAGPAVFPLMVSDLPQTLASSIPAGSDSSLTLPASITGVFREGEDRHRYVCKWKKGETWTVTVDARKIGSPLDVALGIIGLKGKELRSEDLPGTTDAALDFTVPVDGTYEIVINDTAGKSGTPASIYHLEINQPQPDFALKITTPSISVPLGGKFDLAVKAIRKGGFKDAIPLKLTGLPEGVIAPADLAIPADKTDLVIPLTTADTIGTGASLVKLEGTATIASKAVSRLAEAPTTTFQTTRDPEENRTSAILVAATMKPRAKGRTVDADTGRKVPRGATFPAEISIERLEGYKGEVTLMMAAKQSYQMQGISGPELLVPAGVDTALYPCYMPEWLETTRTSRMGTVVVAKIPDPKGKVRYLVGEVGGFITMTMEGALLKLSNEDSERTLPAGKPFDVRLKIQRVTKLNEPVTLQLELPKELQGKFQAAPVTVDAKQDKVTFRVTPMGAFEGPCTFQIRGLAMQEGKYAVISYAPVMIDFVP